MATMLLRKDSHAYWDAESWDPDIRVYVGAALGDTYHREAVHPEAGEPKGVSPPTRPVPDFAPKLPADGSEHSASSTRLTRSNSEEFWDDMQISGPTAGPLLPSAAPGRLPGPDWASTDLGSASPRSQASEASSFWDQPGFMGNGGLDCPQLPQAADGGGSTPAGLPRVNSGAYWDADQWDPDSRVYVGADAGQTNHLVAVDLRAQEQSQLLWRLWPAGLAASGLGLPCAAGAPLDCAGLPGGRPSVADFYDLGEMLGAGSFGAVRSGTHRASGRCCAVKSLGKNLCGERFRKNLVEDGIGELLLQLTRDAPHLNVAEHLDLLEGPNHWYSIMEELTGPELMEQLEEQFPVTEAYVQRVMPQVLKPLAHIHGKRCRLAHRDVKLANYKFRSRAPEAPLVLLDFGFACRLDEPWDGIHCGTPMFMAPEVIGSTARMPHIAAMDVWAAGVIMFLFFTGDSPIQEEEVALFSRPEAAEKAQAVLEKALGARELKLASVEAYDLLRNLLVIDPARRLTAEEALSHACWRSMDGSDRALPVTGTSLARARARSASRSSWNLSRSRSVRSMGEDAPLPDIGGLERIVSEGDSPNELEP